MAPAHSVAAAAHSWSPVGGTPARGVNRLFNKLSVNHLGFCCAAACLQLHRLQRQWCLLPHLARRLVSGLKQGVSRGECCRHTTSLKQGAPSLARCPDPPAGPTWHAAAPRATPTATRRSSSSLRARLQAATCECLRLSRCCWDGAPRTCAYPAHHPSHLSPATCAACRCANTARTSSTR
jgi:hypothetical protein